MLAYLYQLQNQPMRVLEEQLRLSQMAAANANNPLGLPAGPPVNKSLGEVTFGQGAGQQAPGGPRVMLVQPGGQRASSGQVFVNGPQPVNGIRKLSPAAQSASMGEAPSPGE